MYCVRNREIKFLGLIDQARDWTKELFWPLVTILTNKCGSNLFVSDWLTVKHCFDEKTKQIKRRKDL